MPRCEDFPACGHGPAPWGDDGGCPDEQGRFRCVLCGQLMEPRQTSSICNQCRQPGGNLERVLDEEDW